MLFKDWFLKKMFFKRAKTRRLFPPQNYRLRWFFYSNWKQFQVFKIAEFEFKVTVHYGLYGQNPLRAHANEIESWFFES